MTIVVPDLTQKGTKDPQLIPWLADQGYSWITKDDEAKREHAEEIIRAGLSVVWVRGVGDKHAGSGRKNWISVRQVFLILAVVLPKIEIEIAKARGRADFEAWLNAGRPTHKRRDMVVGARRRTAAE